MGELMIMSFFLLFVNPPRSCVVYTAVSQYQPFRYTNVYMKILLNDKEVTELLPEHLPLLIHGAEKSGASMYTIALAAQWFSQDYEIIFLCGYPMAEEAFNGLVSRTNGKAKFFTKDKVEEFIDKVKTINDKTIIIIKNAELFDDRPIKALTNKKLIIISGDINQASTKDVILNISFATQIYFSEFPDVDTSKLLKYTGLVVSDDFNGIASLAE